MADRSHLTAVPTTDKRGRATTVYRNLGARPGANGARVLPPAPSLATPSPRGTPLPATTVRSREEISAFETTMAESLKGLFFVSGFNPVGRYRSDPTGAAAVSLALDLSESGAFDTGTGAFLIYKTLGQGKVAGPTFDALRIAARLWPFGDRPSGRGHDWAAGVCRAVVGLSASRLTGAPRIATVEELDASAAVARFVIDHQSETSLVASDWVGVPPIASARVRNRHLEALLHDRSDDIDRIIAYIAERGMHTSRRRDVTELRAWLDSDTPAVVEGWL